MNNLRVNFIRLEGKLNNLGFKSIRLEGKLNNHLVNFMRRIIQFANYFGKSVDKFAIGFFFYFLAGSKFISLEKK